MTCIVGVAQNGSVWIGGDSAGSNSSWDIQLRSEPKVFRNGEFLMGFTTSWRMGQLLEHSLKPPSPREGQDAMDFLVTGFVEAVRECLKKGGWTRTKDQRDEGGTFLVGFRGAVYTVGPDFQIGSVVWRYAACGCGSQYALGSLCHSEGLPPEQRVEKALEAAERHSAGVAGPFTVLTLPPFPPGAGASSSPNDRPAPGAGKEKK